MAQAPMERASGHRRQHLPYSLSGMEDHPPTDRHLSVVLGAADADLLTVISVLALSGMRFGELRRLRVAHCGDGAFRVSAHAENHGSRAVPIHSALARTAIRLTRGRAGDAFLIHDGAESERAPSPMQRQIDACCGTVGVRGPSPTLHSIRPWFVLKALDAGQPPGTVAAVVGHPRPDDARPNPTWDQRCACVEAVRLPKAVL